MKTVYIIVEGQTEEEFVNNSLAHHLKGKGIVNTVPILLATSPGFYGGDLTFARYRLNANNLLMSDPGGIVTSLIDYYRLRTDFPGHATSLGIADRSARMDYLESQISGVITSDRFLPYIQLHEFEGLLFSDIRGFNYISKISTSNRAQIQYIVNSHPNPEMINDGPTTAPSVRLKSLIPRYKKTLHGPIIALENGMAPLLAKCPRFAAWIAKIEHEATTA
jgi:hypothetical protein